MYNNFQKLLFLFQDLSVLFIDEWKNKDTKNSWTEIKDKLKIQLSFKSSPIFNIFPFKFISIKIYVYTTWQLIFQNIEKSSIFFFFFKRYWDDKPPVKLFTPDTVSRHHVSHPTISQPPSRIRVKMPIRTLLNFASQ